MPAKQGAERSVTPIRCSIEMLRQIRAGVKLSHRQYMHRFPREQMSDLGLAIIA